MIGLEKGYGKVCDLLDKELSDLQTKVLAFKKLSDEMEKIRDDVERNDLLDLEQKLDGLKAGSASISKVLSSCLDWSKDATLLRMTEEGLENYSRNGKLFYPSTTRRYSLADRIALEDFIKKDIDNLEVLGNTLNSKFVTKYLDENEELPPGINSYSKTTLNVRKK